MSGKRKEPFKVAGYLCVLQRSWPGPSQPGRNRGWEPRCVPQRGGPKPSPMASAEQWGTFRPEAEASNQAGMPLGGGPPSTAAVAGGQGERWRKIEKEIEWDQDPFLPAERAREGPGGREEGNAGESVSEQERVRRQTDRQTVRDGERERERKRKTERHI